MASHTKSVEKYRLKNGLTLLVYPLHTAPKVSVQMWYNVGSKDEGDGEHGLAHFLEHMMFKGTKNLSESDIALTTNKLSGACNAFTSQDYTGYLYDMPSQHWYEALPLFAECMANASFKDELINAELKTVIQELKMYRDDYDETLTEQMTTAIFNAHPYHHPIIGYKQEIWEFNREKLLSFYKRYYAPNNATLVVVGDIESSDAVRRVTEIFESIPVGPEVQKKQYAYTADTISTSVTLYRDIVVPTVQYAFVIPGAQQKQEHLAQIVALLLCNGRGSRLYKKLVDDLQIATDIEACTGDMFDHSLFFITVTPKDISFIPQIEDVIRQELLSVHQYGFLATELERAKKRTMMSHLLLFDNFEQLAYETGKYFIASGDENYIIHLVGYLERDDLMQQVYDFCCTYLRPTVMHNGFVLPISDEDRERWLEQQAQEDELDEKIVARFDRVVPFEQPRYALQVVAQEPHPVALPHVASHVLDNGLQVFLCERGDAQLVELAFDFKGKYFYEPLHLQGLSLFLSRMLLEGTQNYSCQELAQAIESRGMSLSIIPGFINLTMLSGDIEYGCSLLYEILTRSVFSPEAIEKVREQLLADLDDFWNDPAQFSGYLIREQIYRGHPYEKNLLGTKESIACIQRSDLVDFCASIITPRGTNLALVGCSGGVDVLAIIKKTLGVWQGPDVADIEYPALVSPQSNVINYPLNRDQVTLTYAGLSVARIDKDYEKLLLFDQLFTGGSSGSMSCRLFQLREESGFFYTIGGSLIAGSSDQPGAMVISTMVSLDSLKDAEKLIENAIQNATVGVTQQEFTDAKNWLLHSFIDHIDSNAHVARTVLFLARYSLPYSYFDDRMKYIETLKLDDVLSVVRKIVRLDALIKVRIGRVK